MPKKAFKETKFGQFLDKAKDVIIANGGDVLSIAATAVTNPIKAISEAKELLGNASAKREEADSLFRELESQRLDMQLELEKLNVELVKSHHDLEKVQLQQDDLWTKRARPTRQYFWLLVICLISYLDYQNNMAGKELIFLTFNNPLLYIMGADFGYYQFQRTKEKMAGVAK